MGKPIKMTHKLSSYVINPKSIQSTSMKFAVPVFHESTINALQYYSENEGKSWGGTVKFLKIVNKLWNVLNVKNTSLGLRKRDITRDPVRHSFDWKITFLNEFNCWVEKWIELGRRGLSRETFFALSQTNKALIDLINHLFSEGFNYILLGQFQSDMLESRFGWYRQMSGANYYLSLN